MCFRCDTHVHIGSDAVWSSYGAQEAAVLPILQIVPMEVSRLLPDQITCSHCNRESQTF